MRILYLTHFSLIALLGLSACAGTKPSDTNAVDARQQQSLRIDVLDARGTPITGLACRLSNEHGYFLAQSGSSVLVKRSARDLDIDCDAPQGLHTRGQLRPRAEAGSAPSAAANKSGNGTSVYGSVGLGSFGSRGGVGINIGFPIPIGTASDPAPSAAVQNNLWR